MKLLEHPKVLSERRRLDRLIDNGFVISYHNLRWSCEHGITYTLVPLFPINFVHTEIII